MDAHEERRLAGVLDQVLANRLDAMLLKLDEDRKERESVGHRRSPLSWQELFDAAFLRRREESSRSFLSLSRRLSLRQFLSL